MYSTLVTLPAGPVTALVENHVREEVCSTVQWLDGYGWWDRPQQAREQMAEGLQITIFGTRFGSDAMLGEYLAITGEHAAYCHGVEPGTLIYTAGIAHEDGDRDPDVKAGDLLFVAAFVDDAAVIQHRDDPRHVRVQARLEAVERERTFLQSFRAGGERSGGQ